MLTSCSPLLMAATPVSGNEPETLSARAALGCSLLTSALANKAGPFEEMLTLAASLGTNRDAQSALLRGLASDGADRLGRGRAHLDVHARREALLAARQQLHAVLDARHEARVAQRLHRDPGCA